MTRGCSPIGFQTGKASQQTTTHANLNGRLGQMARPRFKSGASVKPFLNIPLDVLRSPACRTLRSYVFRVLCLIAAQYRGRSNGDMSIARPIMEEFGMCSRRQIFAAVKILEEQGLVVMTRQGGRNRCNLYAVTWLGIDYCDGKLDIPERKVPTNEWRRWRPKQPE